MSYTVVPHRNLQKEQKLGDIPMLLQLPFGCPPGHIEAPPDQVVEETTALSFRDILIPKLRKELLATPWNLSRSSARRWPNVSWAQATSTIPCIELRKSCCVISCSAKKLRSYRKSWWSEHIHGTVVQFIKTHTCTELFRCSFGHFCLPCIVLYESIFLRHSVHATCLKVSHPTAKSVQLHRHIRNV